MRRRRFLASAALGAAAAALPTRRASAEDPAQAAPGPFALRYAPHFGMFKELGGRDLVGQLEFARDQGFTAWEDNEMRSRPVEEQTRIAEAMSRLGIAMGVISALRGVWSKVNFAGSDDSAREEVLTAMKGVVDVARRVNATFLTVVTGLADPKLPEGYQFANCVELLKRCCDVVEPHGLVMVLEPLNRKKNHPGVYLSESPHAFALCRAVKRPSCKILFDIYHQQITEGNLLSNIDLCWDEIAYLQSGDNPGRNEPGTGEINYRNVLAHLARKNYRGIVGMEHGNSGKGAAGERAVIAAYRAVDPAPPVPPPG
jgi:hydroxypyruvate isomerase